MAGTLTPLMVMSGIGFMRNTGLTVSRPLQSVVSSFSSTNIISGKVQSIITPNHTNLISVLNKAPRFLTGIPSSNFSFTGGTVLNLPQAIVNQGFSLFKTAGTGQAVKVSAFTNVFSQASGYAAQTLAYQGLISQVRGMKFNDFGFQFGNYSDIITGGVTNQFDKDYLYYLADEFPNLGTFFDTKDLSTMTDPISVTKNLLDHGLGMVGDLETKILNEELNLDEPDDTTRTILIDIFESISGSDLDEIIQVTNLNPYKPENIKTLADTLIISNILSENACAALGSGATFDDLSRKLSNLGGHFSNAEKLSSMYARIKTDDFPRLSSLDNLVPDDILEGIDEYFPQGTGIFGNPTIHDLTGSASGLGYTNDVEKMVDLQTRLISTDEDVAALAEYLDTMGNIDPEMDSIESYSELASLIENINTKPGLQEVLATGEGYMTNSSQRLSTEQNNLSLAQITVGSGLSSSSDMFSFSSGLHGFAQDPLNLGLGEQLENMATDDIYGEAMHASLIEGQNLGQLAIFGIDPGTKLDPLAYARYLRSLA